MLKKITCAGVIQRQKLSDTRSTKSIKIKWMTLYTDSNSDNCLVRILSGEPFWRQFCYLHDPITTAYIRTSRAYVQRTIVLNSQTKTYAYILQLIKAYESSRTLEPPLKHGNWIFLLLFYTNRFRLKPKTVQIDMIKWNHFHRFPFK